MNGSLDEEQRLLYVAVTRSKEELTISAPNQYNGYYSKISRFLEPFAEHFKQI
jgi:superfamily I DNA/RNA helicase